MQLCNSVLKKAELWSCTMEAQCKAEVWEIWEWRGVGLCTFPSCRRRVIIFISSTSPPTPDQPPAFPLPQHSAQPPAPHSPNTLLRLLSSHSSSTLLSLLPAQGDQTLLHSIVWKLPVKYDYHLVDLNSSPKFTANKLLFDPSFLSHERIILQGKCSSSSIQLRACGGLEINVLYD